MNVAGGKKHIHDRILTVSLPRKCMLLKIKGRQFVKCFHNIFTFCKGLFISFLYSSKFPITITTVSVLSFTENRGGAKNNIVDQYKGY